MWRSQKGDFLDALDELGGVLAVPSFAFGSTQ